MYGIASPWIRSRQYDPNPEPVASSHREALSERRRRQAMIKSDVSKTHRRRIQQEHGTHNSQLPRRTHHPHSAGSNRSSDLRSSQCHFNIPAPPSGVRSRIVLYRSPVGGDGRSHIAPLQCRSSPLHIGVGRWSYR